MEVDWNTSGSVSVVDSEDERLMGGMLIVPWSSRIARPEGVWRSWGRGSEELGWAAARGGGGGGWRGIVGMVGAVCTEVELQFVGCTEYP